jgi:uncharacterized protein involved in exopolysaccharide biosynthesis
MAHQSAIADLSEILFRHKFKIVLIPLFIGLMTVALIIFFPRTYRSEARLFLQLGRESVAIDPTATTGPSTALIQNNRDEEVKSALQVIGSRGIISQVVDRLGPDFIHHGPPSEIKEVNPVVESIKNAVGSVTGVLKMIDPISAREDAIIPQIAIKRMWELLKERNMLDDTIVTTGVGQHQIHTRVVVHAVVKVVSVATCKINHTRD